MLSTFSSDSNQIEKNVIEKRYSLVGKRLFASNAVAVIMIDKEGIILKTNSSFETWIGLSSKNLIGKNINDVVENTRLHLVAKSGIPEFKQVQEVKGQTIIVDRLPLISDTGEKLGALGVVLFDSYDQILKLLSEIETQQQIIKKYESQMKKYDVSNNNFSDIIGRTEIIKKAKNDALKASKTDIDVLITGESGTGKELFAHAIHKSSNRRDKPFITVNCSAIPSQLAEAELFGYEPGAFTGANSKGRKGKFELANEGTIFLDEIGDMLTEIQPKILRVIQEREIERIGGNEPISLDIRIIAATNADLMHKISNGDFRRDLFYRLNAFVLNLPPLRERKEDIPILVDAFLAQICEKYCKRLRPLSNSSIVKILTYDWPGNVRELYNVIERTVVLSENNESEFTISNLNNVGEIGDFVFNRKIPIQDVSESSEVSILLKVLRETNGNKSRAAKVLGIDRTTLYRKIERYDLKSLCEVLDSTSKLSSK